MGRRIFVPPRPPFQLLFYKDSGFIVNLLITSFLPRGACRAIFPEAAAALLLCRQRSRVWLTSRFIFSMTDEGGFTGPRRAFESGSLFP